ncbi:LysR family transcriptional regulator [Clostridium sp. MCC353]|uniref:LysR family transcriptional regulator n=1 Tax=Clostridium sp. MCC353 TaxID=2592646 RepID=UPI001C0304D0|nr:LysR family transcriptional regulator [Clostridium sp. MCC353]MBT9779657.1 LysR family transcriptional regulator [Clostridium sp. MCC353]
MEFRVLKYFLTTINENNITRAAEVLHITQPTLSRQLMDLEEELGTTLFIRGKRSLVLTDDGLLFKQRAEEIVELTERASREFLDRESISGVIALGATESVGSRTLAKLIKRFSDLYPEVCFDLYNEMADNVKDRIDRGLVDIGFVLEPVDTTKYDFMRISQKETWGILVPSNHPLAGKKNVSVQEASEYPLILPKRENVRNEILNWIGKEESHLRVMANYTLLSNIVLLVQEGVGCAICLDGALAIGSRPEVTFVPLMPERTTRSVFLWKKNRMFSPAASLFIQMIKQGL